MKKIIIAIVVVVVVALGVYSFIRFNTSNSGVDEDGGLLPPTSEEINSFIKFKNISTSTKVDNKLETVIGKSVGDNNITAYHYGNGATEILFVAGIHGSYEWNTGAVALDLMDYLKANPSVIPENIKVTVIPVLNPDGMAKGNGTTVIRSASEINNVPEGVLISGRFNGNNVDLNRNFDCDWQTKGTWQSKTVSGGSSAFSEPETKALKNYIETNKPKAVVAYYSAAGGVYSSNCHTGILPETSAMTTLYAKASGYTANEDFNFYETTGDMTNWLAKIKIPAISILLTNHNDTEWTKNLAGIKAIFKYYTK